MDAIVNDIRRTMISIVESKNLQSINEKKSILEDLIDETFFKTLENSDLINSFVTIVNVYVLKKLSSRIDDLFIILPPLENSVDSLEKKIYNSLISFRKDVIKTYGNQLKGSSEFEKHKKSILSVRNSIRDFLLNPSYSYEEDEFIEGLKPRYFKNRVDIGFENTKKYFKNLFESNEDKEGAVIQLTEFIIELNKKLGIISKGLIVREGKLNFLNDNISDKGAKDVVLDDDSIIQVDLFENDLYNLIDLENELENDKYLKIKLMEFKEYAFRVYGFLNDKFSNILLKKDVFGSFNYDRLDSFFNEFKFFVDENVTKENFIEVFTSFKVYEKDKINLCNGSQANYGDIINRLYSFFSKPEFIVKNNYYEWWASRFTFDGKCKEAKDIGRFISKKSSKNKEQVDSIIKILT